MSDPQAPGSSNENDFQIEVTQVDLPNGQCFAVSLKSPDKESENEDKYRCVELSSSTSLLFVADGMGGHRGGDFASGRAIQSTLSFLRNKSRNLAGYLISGIEKAHADIMAKGIGAGSTLVAALIEENSVRFFNVGDSLGLQIGGLGAVKYQTIEHSPYGFAVESGLVEDDSKAMEDERHYVSNVLGHGEIRIEVSQKLLLAKRDTVLLGTDGLFSNISKEEICETFRKGSISQSLGEIVSEAYRRMTMAELGSPDDLTAVVFKRKS